MTIISRYTARLTGPTGRGALVALLLAIAACSSGPPVQEMSDARQAIAVAREAGAAKLAPHDLRLAEDYLSSAQQNLSQRAYAQARRDAVAAKSKALDALATTETSSQNNPPR